MSEIDKVRRAASALLLISLLSYMPALALYAAVAPNDYIGALGMTVGSLLYLGLPFTLCVWSQSTENLQYSLRRLLLLTVFLAGLFAIARQFGYFAVVVTYDTWVASVTCVCCARGRLPMAIRSAEEKANWTIVLAILTIIIHIPMIPVIPP